MKNSIIRLVLLSLIISLPIQIIGQIEQPDIPLENDLEWNYNENKLNSWFEVSYCECGDSLRKIKRKNIDLTSNYYVRINGQCIMYNNDHVIMKSGEFKDGLLWNGRHYIYDEDELLYRIKRYRDGKYYNDVLLMERILHSN
ncbi:MAG: hypothetical protein QNK23_04980 [Crocinitomicaceae bacterium]|nr:hypothetical protein [Crocinitomicaceae bacterium]